MPRFDITSLVMQQRALLVSVISFYILQNT